MVHDSQRFVVAIGSHAVVAWPDGAQLAASPQRRNGPRFLHAAWHLAIACGIGIWLSGTEVALCGEVGGRAATEVATLIQQLGHEVFSVREKATDQLMGMGIEIKPDLVAAREHADAEVRFRVERILAVVVERDFQRRVQAFAADVDDRLEHDLPGWAQFRWVVGGQREARSLFVEMLQAEPALWEAYATDRKAAGKLLAERVRHVQLLARLGMHGAQRGGVDMPTIASLLFVAADPDVPLAEEAIAALFGLPNQAVFQVAVTSGPRANAFKRLLGRWIERDTGQNWVTQSLWLAMRFGLAEGLTPAQRLLKQQAGAGHSRYLALLVLGKFGGIEHVSLVEPLLADATVCATHRAGREQIKTEVRDVALVVLLRLTGQNPKSYGFDRLQANDQMLYSVNTIGFANQEDRDRALQQWAIWSQQNRAGAAADDRRAD
jgi:hypothetical protein